MDYSKISPLRDGKASGESTDCGAGSVDVGGVDGEGKGREELSDEQRLRVEQWCRIDGMHTRLPVCFLFPR